MKRVRAKLVGWNPARWRQWKATQAAAKKAWRTGEKIRVWVTTPSGVRSIQMVPFKSGSEMEYAFKFHDRVVVSWHMVYQTRAAALKATVRNLKYALARNQSWAAQLGRRYTKALAAYDHEIAKWV